MVYLTWSNLNHGEYSSTSPEISSNRSYRSCLRTFWKPSKNCFSQSASGNDKGLIVREAEGIHILTRRKSAHHHKNFKNKNGIDGISFCTEDMTPGRKMRVHKHLNNDELIFIHKGRRHTYFR